MLPGSGRPRDWAQVRPGQWQRAMASVGRYSAAAALFAVVLLLLLIFILENGQRVSISYFGAHGHLPVGVALLRVRGGGAAPGPGADGGTGGLLPGAVAG